MHAVIRVAHCRAATHGKRQEHPPTGVDTDVDTSYEGPRPGTQRAMAIPRHLFRRSRSLLYGLALPYEALRLVLATRVLLFWSLLPLVVTLVLYIYVLGGLQEWAAAQLQAYFLAWGWDAEGWALWLVSVASGVLLVLAGALTFTFVSTIIASPFNDILAEKTEAVATPPLPRVANPGLRAQLRLVWIDLAKSVAATAAGVVALLVSLVPLLNVVSAVAVCLLVCFQYTSYPQTRRQEGIARGLGFLVSHAWACTGFGAAITVLYAIPFVSSFALPLAVVGGTLLVARARAGPELPPLK
jgi:CysZ protein